MLYLFRYFLYKYIIPSFFPRNLQSTRHVTLCHRWLRRRRQHPVTHLLPRTGIRPWRWTSHFLLLLFRCRCHFFSPKLCNRFHLSTNDFVCSPLHCLSFSANWAERDVLPTGKSVRHPHLFCLLLHNRAVLLLKNEKYVCWSYNFVVKMFVQLFCLSL